MPRERRVWGFIMSLKGMRDGALIGVLLYSLAYAAYQLRDPVLPLLSNATARMYLDRTHNMVHDMGMAGVGYFALVGAGIGVIPWGSLFGKGEQKRKNA